MKKIVLLGAVLLAGIHFPLWASFEPSQVFVNGTAYDLNSSTTAPDFDGASLGTFNPLSDELLLDADMVILNDFFVEFARLGYAVYDSEGANIGGVIDVAGFLSSSTGSTETWKIRSSNQPNLLDGLGEGTYTVEVYLVGSYQIGEFDSQIFYEDNNNLNYTASYIVIPETSSWILAGIALATAGLLFRKRRN
jgi:hypothetical protein